MTTQEAIDYYKGRKELAHALGIWPHTTYKWGERPPLNKQFELEVKTNGKLKADLDAKN